MNEALLLRDVAIALVFALAGGLVARRLNLSPIIGYLVAGLVIGPFTPGYRADTETLRHLAEVGVVFLLFGVGLHFKLADLIAARRFALPAASVQIVLVAVAAAATGAAAGLPLAEAAVFGMAVTISSTVVLVRALEERGLTASPDGRALIGWLIVQDFATIVMLVLLPIVAADSAGAAERVLGTAVRAAVFTAFVLLAGSRLLPSLLRLVGRTGSRELFVLTVVCLSLGVAEGAALAGLSLALGAFIAGVTVGETDASHRAASDLLPLRDAFAVLFFVSVGMLIDPRALLAAPAVFVMAIIAIVVVKPLAIAIATPLFKASPRTVFLAAAGLAQAGEFSFILAEAGRTIGLLSAQTYHALLGASVVSIAVNPALFRLSAAVQGMVEARRLGWRRGGRWSEQTVVAPLQYHVLIAGGGRIGRFVSEVLDRAGVPYAVIDISMETVLELRREGRTAHWGDASSAEVLEAAAIQDARLLILTMPDAGSARLAAERARARQPGIPVVARAQSADAVALLAGGAVDFAVVPEFEGAAVIAEEALRSLALDEPAIRQVVGAGLEQAYRTGHLADPGA